MVEFRSEIPVAATSFNDSCQIWCTVLILPCDPAICKHSWPVTFRLSAASSAVWKLLVHDRDVTHLLARTAYRIPFSPNPLCRYQCRIGRKTLSSSARPLCAHVCQGSAVVRWKTPISWYNPPSFLACPACNRDTSLDPNTQAEQLCCLKANCNWGSGEISGRVVKAWSTRLWILS